MLQTPAGKTVAHCQFPEWTQSPCSPTTALLLPFLRFRLMLREQRASAFNGASQFFILLAPTPLNYPPSLSILGMAVEILAQTFRRLPGCQTEQKGSFKQRANSPDTHTLIKSLHLWLDLLGSVRDMFLPRIQWKREWRGTANSAGYWNTVFSHV